jgi:cobalamin synthase
MSFWHHDQKTGVHTTDNGPQVWMACFLLAVLLIRVYFGVNWALAFAAVTGVVVAAAVSITWMMTRVARRDAGNVAGTGT